MDDADGVPPRGNGPISRNCARKVATRDTSAALSCGPAQIMAAVDRCPSGALGYTYHGRRGPQAAPCGKHALAVSVRDLELDVHFEKNKLVLCHSKVEDCDHERNPAQDGFIQRNVDGHIIRYRVSILPIVAAEYRRKLESIVIRVLDDRKVVTDLTRLGLTGQAREDFEKRYIWRKYQESGGNMSRTADLLQVERSNLYRKMKQLGIQPNAARNKATEANR